MIHDGRSPSPLPQMYIYNKFANITNGAGTCHMHINSRDPEPKSFRENSQRSVPHTMTVSGTSAAPSVCVYIYICMYSTPSTLRFGKFRGGLRYAYFFRGWPQFCHRSGLLRIFLAQGIRSAVVACFPC